MSNEQLYLFCTCDAGIGPLLNNAHYVAARTWRSYEVQWHCQIVLHMRRELRGMQAILKGSA
jgi:hypothetical protein